MPTPDPISKDPDLAIQSPGIHSGEAVPDSTALPPAALTTGLPAQRGRTLLLSGSCMTSAGLLFLVLTETLFGGMDIHGPASQTGWVLLLFALMTIPFGLMLLGMGIVRQLRRNRLRYRAS